MLMLRQKRCDKIDQAKMHNAERCRLSRNNIMISCAVCFASQAALLAALFGSYFQDQYIAVMFTPVVSVWMLITRFICGLILHLALFEEFGRGIKLMKFAMNHSDVFDCSGAAFTVAMMQATITLMVEVLNILVICMSNNVGDVVMNFIALAIIADFDDFIY